MEGGGASLAFWVLPVGGLLLGAWLLSFGSAWTGMALASPHCTGTALPEKATCLCRGPAPHIQNHRRYYSRPLCTGAGWGEGRRVEGGARVETAVASPRTPTPFPVVGAQVLAPDHLHSAPSTAPAKCSDWVSFHAP